MSRTRSCLFMKYKCSQIRRQQWCPLHLDTFFSWLTVTKPVWNNHLPSHVLLPSGDRRQSQLVITAWYSDVIVAMSKHLAVIREAISPSFPNKNTSQQGNLHPLVCQRMKQTVARPVSQFAYLGLRHDRASFRVAYLCPCETHHYTLKG